MREWDAAAYHRLSDPQFVWGRAVVERVAAVDTSRYEWACDAGCGTGRLTAELCRVLPETCRVLAVDSSENMLKTARETLAPVAARLEFACADFQHLPFVHTFDLIFSTAAFHWAPDHDLLFRSLHRALKPGGRLIAQCGGGTNLARIRAREQSLMRDPRFAMWFETWVPPWHYADPETTCKRMSNAGFVEVEAWLEPAPVTMPDERSYRAFLQTVVGRAQVARIIDVEARERYLDELIRAADGDFTFDYCRLNLQGRASDSIEIGSEIAKSRNSR